MFMDRVLITDLVGQIIEDAGFEPQKRSLNPEALAWVWQSPIASCGFMEVPSTQRTRTRKVSKLLSKSPRRNQLRPADSINAPMAPLRPFTNLNQSLQILIAQGHGRY